MAFLDDLQRILEEEERATVGSSFGGSGKTKSFSIARLRDALLEHAPFAGSSPTERALKRAFSTLDGPTFRLLVPALLRFSFLIELTNLTVGSTKMKTRWLPGKILMPQHGTFEPVRGSFEPGNDPRAASFAECCAILSRAADLVCDAVSADDSFPVLITELNAVRRVPYEFPFGYVNDAQQAVHAADNVRLIVTPDLHWLLKARRALKNAPAAHRDVLRAIEKKKLEVKVFKTDRALTGKDKTNRAKRWEVLYGDFQHATLQDCWSAERKLTADLAGFAGFPEEIKGSFQAAKLVDEERETTCCPVTLEPLNFRQLSVAMLDPKHGISDYQVGHLHPLKRGGKHDGANVCWQSANGNRIQGDLSIEETEALLQAIAARRASRRTA